MAYNIAILHQDPETDYGLCFPDFPGCVVAENNLEGLKAAAEEALAGHLLFLAESGAAVPPPTPIEAIMTDPDFADDFPTLIHAPESPTRWCVSMSPSNARPSPPSTATPPSAAHPLGPPGLRRRRRLGGSEVESIEVGQHYAQLIPTMSRQMKICRLWELVYYTPMAYIEAMEGGFITVVETPHFNSLANKHLTGAERQALASTLAHDPTQGD